MSTDGHGGTTALDRLRAHYEDADLTCPSCGYDDEDGRWRVETTGDRVYYRHLCPSCGASRTRTVRLG